MPKFAWNSDEKEREWEFAEKKLIQNSQLISNGSKLRRKDFPAFLNHSFMIMDDQIIALSGKGIYLGHGYSGHAKLAEDKEGNLYALKIIKNKMNANEAEIANDLGIARKEVSRINHLNKKKYYISYKYLGVSVRKYLLEHKELSHNTKLELCIQISLALHDLHSGNHSESKTAYSHGDISRDNIVIDDQNNPHFIDFGKTQVLPNNPKQNAYNFDVLDILSLFKYDIALEFPKDLYDYFLNAQILTALDVAGILTLSRFNLESYRTTLEQQSKDKQLEIIKALNTMNAQERYDMIHSGIGLFAPKKPELADIPVSVNNKKCLTLS